MEARKRLPESMVPMAMQLERSTSTIYDEDGSAIVLSLRGSLRRAQALPVSLNPSAGRVWRLLTQGATVDEAIAAVANHYEVSEERLRDDLQQTFETLRQAGIWKVRR